MKFGVDANVYRTCTAFDCVNTVKGNTISIMVEFSLLKQIGIHGCCFSFYVPLQSCSRADTY